MTLFGKAVYERAYYVCVHCGTGTFPSDAEFRIAHKQTPAARELISLAGVLGPFEEGARRVLPLLSGLRVSAKTIQRVTESTGQDVARCRAAGESIGPERPWRWHQNVAYVGLDATGVLQQGPHAEKAEGRMPWVAAVFNPQPGDRRGRRFRELGQARYLSGLVSLEEIGRQLRHECLAVGVAQADVVIALTDGGNGLEDCLVTTLGGIAKEIVFILDFYHASEHLLEFARNLCPQEDMRRRVADGWCRALKHRGGRFVYEQLDALDLSASSAEVVEAHRRLMGYLRNNLHRMDYPQYLARSWQIGSGVIESACKGVVCQRMKGRGMRWREHGTTALCQLRALYKSQPDLWLHYWQRVAA